LLLSYFVSFVVVLLASDAILYYFLNSAIRADQIEILNDRFNAISSLLRSDDHGAELARRVQIEWPLRTDEKSVFKIIDGDGHLVVETPDADRAGLTIGFSQNLSTGPQRVESRDGHTFFVETRELSNSIGLKKPVRVYGAIGFYASEKILKTYRDANVAIILVAALICLVIGWHITRRGLAPLQSMTKTVAAIGGTNLDRRIDVDDLATELQPLAQEFNRTFERLEQSFERLSRFSSNIAHELRTPVTNILGELEVYLKRSRSVEEYRDVMASTLEECIRLRDIIESLLFLARAETREQSLTAEKLNARETILKLIDYYEALASDAGLKLVYDSSSPPGDEIHLRAEPILFQQAVGNILLNSIRHSGRNGDVKIFVQPKKYWAVIEVRDNGRGISEDNLPFVFDRFFRSREADSEKTAGFGLGRALVKSIVELHDGQVEIASQQGVGTTVKLTWPLWTELVLA
jgi:two-component system heavy metal sensor histidine kinase CusS